MFYCTDGDPSMAWFVLFRPEDAGLNDLAGVLIAGPTLPPTP